MSRELDEVAAALVQRGHGAALPGAGTIVDSGSPDCRPPGGGRGFVARSPLSQVRSLSSA